ncbi:hypothetical protein BXZ70DRAFT_312370 [Cristinia sonorae]|uniref:RING-type domain-containing protein n=1 Tax=Cristinia sonorae TaxID=1940300 RepID=A0A8K0UL68_9AGAR|nr:hypothetical protein BXZ70DRAFT_312370 [Cristinia sonorae]
MDTVSANVSTRRNEQKSKKRPLSDTEDDESDREDAKRLRSTGVLGNDRRNPEDPSNLDEEASKSNPKKKRRTRKKKRKMSIVDETARAEKPPSDRRSRSSTLTRHSSAKPPSVLSNAPAIAATRDTTPAAGPSRSVQRASPSLVNEGQAVKDELADGALSQSVRVNTPTSYVSHHKIQQSRVGKGKGKAPSVPSRKPSPAIAVQPTAVAGPSSSASASDVKTQLTAHQNALSTLLPSLTCRICLYLMNRPFALAPCGHVVCHSCLVSWFSAPPQNEIGGADPQPALPPAGQNEDDAGILPLPHFLRPQTLIYRKKTCPHCRAVVRERPVEVWGMKEMVASLTASGLVQDSDVIGPAAPDPPASEDPWKDIFPKIGRFSAVMGAPAIPPPPQEEMGFLDAEDGGVYRCLDCMHEIWDGICTNCQREYEGHRGFEDSGSETGDDLGGGLDFGQLLRGALFHGYGARRLAVDDDDDLLTSEDEYGGSFIDDGEVVGGGISDGEDDPEVQIIDNPRPGGRTRNHQARNNAAAPISVSSDEESEEEDIPPRRPATRNAHAVIPISDDEQEESEDEVECVQAFLLVLS